eukprot:GDKJ01051639.1.p1 GENE.GDKJ01051639.1~~GDKJ01051639.1.p1  ORF type:complete len:737 (-),score=267.65 GDKJ01051639.1:59-2269(-)
MADNSNKRKLQAKPLRGDDFDVPVMIKDEYFPDDGYDYEQHLTHIDTSSPLYLQAEDQCDPDFDAVYGKKKELYTAEEQELIEAMENDDLSEMDEEEFLPLQFAAQNEIDSYQLRWGEYTDEDRYGLIDMGHGGVGEFDMGEYEEDEENYEENDDFVGSLNSGDEVKIKAPKARPAIPASQMSGSQTGTKYQRTFIGSQAATKVGRDFDKFTSITSKSVNALKDEDRVVLEKQFDDVRRQYKNSEIGELDEESARGHIPINAMRGIFEEAFETLVLAGLNSKKKNRNFDKTIAGMLKVAERKEGKTTKKESDLDKLMANAKWNRASTENEEGENKEENEEQHDEDQDQDEEEDEEGEHVCTGPDCCDSQDGDEEDEQEEEDWDENWDDEFDALLNSDEEIEESESSNYEGLTDIEIKLKKIAKETFIERHMRVYQSRLKLDPLADMPEELERAIRRQERREIAKSLKKESENGGDVFYREKRAEFRRLAKESWRMNIDDGVRNQIITYMRQHIDDPVDSENVPFIQKLINDYNKPIEDDCETILSTLSSVYNRPTKIGLPKGQKPKALKLVGPHLTPTGVLPSSLAKSVGLKKHHADQSCVGATSTKSKGVNRLAAILEEEDDEDDDEETIQVATHAVRQKAEKNESDSDSDSDSDENDENNTRISKEQRVAKVDKRVKGESTEEKKVRKEAAKDAKKAAREYKKEKKEEKKAAANKKQIMNNPYDVRNGVKAVRM